MVIMRCRYGWPACVKDDEWSRLRKYESLKDSGMSEHSTISVRSATILISNTGSLDKW
jgi:hypothetical protein